MNELALFAGAGGGILGGTLLGWRTVCAVEIDPYCRRVLLARQRDGHLPRFPVWDNIETFDGKPWRGSIDVISGGFPCTDISKAGRGAGIEGRESGLWKEMFRLVAEIRPRYVFVENSPVLVSRGLAMVLGDLAEVGYNARWGIVSAADAGAPHLRERIWIVADSSIGRYWNKEKEVCPRGNTTEPCGNNMAHPDRRRFQGSGAKPAHSNAGEANKEATWWGSEPALGRVADGLANRVDRIKALGNGQVPAVAALAWKILGGPG